MIDYIDKMKQDIETLYKDYLYFDNLAKINENLHNKNRKRDRDLTSIYLDNWKSYNNIYRTENWFFDF